MITLWTFDLYLISFSYKFSNGRHGEKGGRGKNNKIAYLENKNSFFSKLKSVFHNFFKCFHLIKFLQIEETNFHSPLFETTDSFCKFYI